MPFDKIDYSVGNHRPVYLWAGPGTVRMNRLKFMGAPNDEFVHAEAHTEVGAQRMGSDAGFNCAYLMYDWGFPPEIERSDWEEFEKVVPIYQSHGIQVFGYIQTSNCVYDGSYKEMDWYAQDPKGRYIHYYTGRYMTCWLNPCWHSHLQEIIQGVINAGADGLFFDNPWMGLQPLHFGGTWSGPGGCYCSRCQIAFHEATDLKIPQQISPSNSETSRTYLAWRSDVVTRTINSLARYARSLQPDIQISVNDYDTIMHPTYISHGIDLPGLARCQDVVMIEDFALPRYSKDELVNNAITIRTALVLIGDTPLTTDPYDKGIGFDNVYPPRRFQQGIAEAAACGTAMVVKGTEYVDLDGVFTLLTAQEFSLQRQAIKTLQTWLSNHADLYRDRKNSARVGLIYPENIFKTNWDQIAELYFGICQTLTYNGIPWRVVTDRQSLDELEIVFYFEGNSPEATGAQIINVTNLENWSLPKQPSLLENHTVRVAMSGVLSWYYRAYFDYRWTRWLTDKLGITQWFLGSPHFKIPDNKKQVSVLKVLRQVPNPRVSWTESPVLIEVWQQKDETQIHLVNYGSKSQKVTVILDKLASGQLISLGKDIIEFETEQVQLELDVYTVLRY
jgi:hypothetical protein